MTDIDFAYGSTSLGHFEDNGDDGQDPKRPNDLPNLHKDNWKMSERKQTFQSAFKALLTLPKWPKKSSGPWKPSNTSPKPSNSPTKVLQSSLKTSKTILNSLQSFQSTGKVMQRPNSTLQSFKTTFQRSLDMLPKVARFFPRTRLAKGAPKGMEGLQAASKLTTKTAKCSLKDLVPIASLLEELGSALSPKVSLEPKFVNIVHFADSNRAQ